MICIEKFGVCQTPPGGQMNRYTELARRLVRVPPIRLGDDPETAAFRMHFGIGMVAQAFEKLQTQVIQTFGDVCGQEDGGAQLRMMSIISATSAFNIKAEMLENAAESFIVDEARKAAVSKWIRLCRRASDRRNDIVHGTVLSFQEDGVDHVTLVPPFHNPKYGGMMGVHGKEMAYQYNHQQVLDYADAIERVTGNFIEMRMQLRGHPVEPGDEWVLDPQKLVF